MLIKLTAVRVPEGCDRAVSFNTLAPWRIRRARAAGTLIEGGMDCWWVAESYEEVREKWEKALARKWYPFHGLRHVWDKSGGHFEHSVDCACPTYKGHKMHWDGGDKVGPNVSCTCSLAHDGPCKPPPCAGWSQVWATDL